MAIPVFQSNAFQTNAFAQNSPTVPTNNAVTPAEIATPTDAYACAIAFGVSQTESVSPTDTLVGPRIRETAAVTPEETVSPTDSLSAAEKLGAGQKVVSEAGFPVFQDYNYNNGTTSVTGPLFSLGAGTHYVLCIVTWGSNGLGTITSKTLTSANLTWTPVYNYDSSGGPIADIGVEVYAATYTGSLTNEQVTFGFASHDGTFCIGMYSWSGAVGLGATASTAGVANNPLNATLTPLGTGSDLLSISVGRNNLTGMTALPGSVFDHANLLDTLLNLSAGFASLSGITNSTSSTNFGANGGTYNNALASVNVALEIRAQADSVVSPTVSDSPAVKIPTGMYVGNTPRIRSGFPVYASPTSTSPITVPSLSAGDRVYLTVSIAGDGGTFVPVNPPTSSNLTFTLTGSASNATGNTRVWVWSALVGASPLTNEAITVYSSGAGEIVPYVIVFDEASATVGQVTTGNGASGTPTINANVSGGGSKVWTAIIINDGGYVTNYGHAPALAAGNTQIEGGALSGGAWDYHLTSLSSETTGASTIQTGTTDNISSAWAVVSVEILPTVIPTTSEKAALKIPVSAFSPPTLSNHGISSQASSNSVSISVTANAGDYILVCASNDEGNVGIQSPSASNISGGGIAWSLLASQNASANSARTYLFGGFAPTSLSGSTVTVSGWFYSTNNLGIAYQAWSNVSGIGTVTGATGGFATTNVSVVAVGSGSRLAAMGFSRQTATYTWTADASSTKDDQIDYLAGSSDYYFLSVHETTFGNAGTRTIGFTDSTAFDYALIGAELLSAPEIVFPRDAYDYTYFPAGGGTTYTQLESVTPSDSVAANQQMPSTFGSAETATPTEAIYPTLIMPATVGTESVSPTDALATGTKFTLTEGSAETVTPTDSLAAGIIYTGSESETVTPSDSEVPGLTFTLQLQASETTTPSDGLTPGLGIPVSLGAETATPTDNYDSTLSSASGSTNNAITPAEIATPTDSYAASLSSYNTISETVTATDTLGSAQATNSSQVELVSPSDVLDPGVRSNSSLAAETVSPTDTLSPGLKFTLTQNAETASPTDSESPAIASTVTISESVSPTDSLALGLAFTLTQATETVSPTDSEVAGIIYTGAQTETVTPTDQLDHNLKMTASQSEPVTPSDQLAAGQPFYPGALTETVTPTDQQAVTQGLSAIAQTETVSPVDVLGNNARFWSTETESVQPLDSVDGQLPGSFTQLEVASALDGYAASLASANSLSEIVSPTDTLGTSQITNSSQAETVSPTETLAAGNKFTALLGSEIVSPSDSLAATQAIAVSQTETVSPTESSSTTQGMTASETETVTPIESQTGVLPGSFSQVETVTATDNYDSNLKSANTLGTESVSPTDSLAAGTGIRVSQTESVSPTESQSNLVGFSSTLTESVTATDGSSTNLRSANSQAETVTPTEALGTTQKTNSSQTETVSPIDVIDLGDRFTLTETADTATPTDSQAAGTGFSKTLSESVSASDSLAASQRFASGLEEDVSPTEVQSSSQKMTSSLTESVSAVDGYAAGLAIRASQTETVQALDGSATNLSSNNSLTEIVTATEGDDIAASLNASETLEEIVVAVENQDAGQRLTGEILESTPAPDPVLGVPNPGLTTHGFNAGFNEGVDSYFN